MLYLDRAAAQHMTSEAAKWNQHPKSSLRRRRSPPSMARKTFGLSCCCSLSLILFAGEAAKYTAAAATNPFTTTTTPMKRLHPSWGGKVKRQAEEEVFRRKQQHLLQQQHGRYAIQVRGGGVATPLTEAAEAATVVETTTTPLVAAAVEQTSTTNNHDHVVDNMERSTWKTRAGASSSNEQIVEAEAVVDDEQKYKSAVIKTTATLIGAALFGVFLIVTRGPSTGYEFFAGYLVEQSLSIDNLFVFIMLFDYFRVPMELQGRVLSWGIAGAVSLRGIMIAVGVAAIQKFKIVILFFAGILLASSVKLIMECLHEHNNDAAAAAESMEDNVIMKMTSMLFPNTSKEFDGEKFFSVAENGKRVATPLFLCLVCVELSDFVFAVDSIPAVLGVSKDPLIVYASNIFAIMALRSLYTIVAKAVTDLQYLRPAVALVLGFVGMKMIGEYWHFHIGTDTSLAVVCSLLGGGIGVSMWENWRLKKSLSKQATTPLHQPVVAL